MCGRVSVYVCACVCVFKSVAICERFSVDSVSSEPFFPRSPLALVSVCGATDPYLLYI